MVLRYGFGDVSENKRIFVDGFGATQQRGKHGSGEEVGFLYFFSPATSICFSFILRTSSS